MADLRRYGLEFVLRLGFAQPQNFMLLGWTLLVIHGVVRIIAHLLLLGRLLLMRLYEGKMLEFELFSAELGINALMFLFVGTDVGEGDVVSGGGSALRMLPSAPRLPNIRFKQLAGPLRP